MGVNYAAAVKTARITATRDHFANGSLEILTAADALLATFGLDAAGGTIAGDTWTLVLDAATVQASGAGTAAKAQVKNAGGTANLTGLTVGLAGADIIMDGLDFTAGQDVTLSSATIQHA